MAREHAVPAGGWRSRATAAVAVLAVAVVVARPAQADDAHVAMRGVAFVPATVSVRQTAGEPTSPAPHAHVIWTNEDPGTEHTVTFEDPRLVSSGRLVPTQSYEAVISVVGSFPYRCTIHPGMAGTVVVEAAPVTTTAPGGAPAGGGGSGGSTAVVVAGAAAAVAGGAGLAWFLARRRRVATDGPAAP